MQFGEDGRVEGFHAPEDLGEDLHHGAEGGFWEGLSREAGLFVEG